MTVSTNITGESTDGSGILTFDLAASGISSAFFDAFGRRSKKVDGGDWCGHFTWKAIEKEI